MPPRRRCRRTSTPETSTPRCRPSRPTPSITTPPPAQGPGREGFKAFFTELTTAFPDANIQPEKAFADEDNVAVAYTLTGTHQGEFNGIPATGNTIEVRGLQIGRFENGQIVERWGSSDELGIMQQLGAEVQAKSGLAKLADKLGS